MKKLPHQHNVNHRKQGLVIHTQIDISLVNKD